MAEGQSLTVADVVAQVRDGRLVAPMSREIRCLRVSEWVDEVSRIVGEREFGGVIGHSELGEGGRGAENASFGVDVVGIGRDRVVPRRRERPGGDSRVGSGRGTGLWWAGWRLDDADHRGRSGDRAVDFSSGGRAFGDGG
jgi:hypothetical protein